LPFREKQVTKFDPFNFVGGRVSWQVYVPATLLIVLYAKKMGGILCLLLLNRGREIMPTYYTCILTPVSRHNFPPMIEQ
jgi:hypothetical protein